MNISKVAGRLTCPSVYIVCFRDGNIVVSSKIKKGDCEEMNPHFFTVPFLFCFHLVQGSGGGFAAFFYWAMPESGILVMGYQS